MEKQNSMEDEQTQGVNNNLKKCPANNQKTHCSQIEGTESSELPETEQNEFCRNKCPIYKNNNKNT